MWKKNTEMNHLFFYQRTRQHPNDVYVGILNYWAFSLNKKSEQAWTGYFVLSKRVTNILSGKLFGKLFKKNEFLFDSQN